MVTFANILGVDVLAVRHGGHAIGGNADLVIVNVGVADARPHADAAVAIVSNDIVPDLGAFDVIFQGNPRGRVSTLGRASTLDRSTRRTWADVVADDAVTLGLKLIAEAVDIGRVRHFQAIAEVAADDVALARLKPTDDVGGRAEIDIYPVGAVAKHGLSVLLQPDVVIVHLGVVGAVLHAETVVSTRNDIPLRRGDISNLVAGRLVLQAHRVAAAGREALHIRRLGFDVLRDVGADEVALDPIIISRAARNHEVDIPAIQR